MYVRAELRAPNYNEKLLQRPVSLNELKYAECGDAYIIFVLNSRAMSYKSF